MIQLRVCLLFSLAICIQGQGQEEFTHLQYNLTLYGNPFGCDESDNNSNQKEDALNIIIDYVQPDIFTVNEMRDSDVWADRLLDNVLNDEEEVWSRAELTDQFGFSSIVNACYFRNDRFTLYAQEVVYQSLGGSNLLRHIDLYTLYMDMPSLVFGDTAFVTIAVAHLSAGDAIERANQTEALMAYIEARGIDNYIFAGDLNIDSSLETAYQNLINSNDPDFSFIDPVDAAGTWHNNPSFSDYHSQSTRYGDTNEGCFAGGGLDDRFDITLISPYISVGVNGVTYVPNSYEVVGQSGNDYNQELQTIGNQVVPANVAQALYDASDHLPVKTKYTADFSTGLSSVHEQLDFEVSFMDRQLELWIKKFGIYTMSIHDLSGRLLIHEDFNGRGYKIGLSEIRNQAVIINVVSAQGLSAHRIQFIP